MTIDITDIKTCDDIASQMFTYYLKNELLNRHGMTLEMTLLLARECFMSLCYYMPRTPSITFKDEDTVGECQAFCTIEELNIVVTFLHSVYHAHEEA